MTTPEQKAKWREIFESRRSPSELEMYEGRYAKLEVRNAWGDYVEAREDAVVEPQSLPELCSEPVAWAMRNSNGAFTEINCQYVEGIFDVPLYTTPQPAPKQITADDVTHDMESAFSKQFTNGAGMTNDDVIAAAVNAWIKHRSIK